MKTMKEIEKMLSECGASDFRGTKKEVKELPNVIHDDEIITYATSGLWEGNTWLIISTDKRVIFLDKGILFGLKQIEIPLNKINSIGQKKGLLFGEIEIWDGASKMKITHISKETLIPFVNAVNKAKEELEKPKQHSINQVSAADELIKFKRLLDQGVITQEEFDKKKKELLG
ncbi:MAG: PH domain-containing protein [Leptotrichiaceae bacterium]|nr:PH domain-containing protein [Leptotrichiaceae bacterium]